jgi:UDP-glucose 4-epimerase
MKALITGIAGFIGSHLGASLLDAGNEVVGIDCFTDYYKRTIKESNLSSLTARKGFQLVESPIQSAPLSDLLKDIDQVFHLAAQAGVRKSWGQHFGTYTANNIEATQRLLEACVQSKIKRLIYASSSSVYGDNVSIPMKENVQLQPISPYGVTKLAAEQLCYLYHVNHGVPSVSLRYFTVYGPRQRPDMAFHRFLTAVLENRPVTLYGDGDQTRDFTFVSDAVAATLAAGEQGEPGRVYNIGGGSRISINNVLKMIGNISGQQVQIIREQKQEGDMRDTYADTFMAYSDLNFRPKVRLEEGLRAEYHWLLDTLSA